MYAEGRGKTLLNKNVITTGRLHTILDVFPDARIVYLIRDPESAVPSFISMFSTLWKWIAPNLSENGAEYRALGQIAIDLYNYFHSNKNKFDAKNFYVIPYKKLIANPIQAIEDVYAHFEMDMSNTFRGRLEAHLNSPKKYESQHTYSLEKYGFTKAEIEEKLEAVMEEYGFLTVDGGR